MSAIAFPYFTAATAVVLGTFQMLLLFYVARGRGRFRTGIGDGGHDGLIRRIRIHANLAENLPIFLILLGLVEMSGEWRPWVPIFAVAFIVVRLSHALGLRISGGLTAFRFVGALGTLVSILGLAALLATTLARDTSWLQLPQFG
jgi:uncharacterized membrane protein YecN with MAPEG domain